MPLQYENVFIKLRLCCISKMLPKIFKLILLKYCIVPIAVAHVFTKYVKRRKLLYIYTQ